MFGSSYWLKAQIQISQEHQRWGFRGVRGGSCTKIDCSGASEVGGSGAFFMSNEYFWTPHLWCPWSVYIWASTSKIYQIMAILVQDPPLTPLNPHLWRPWLVCIWALGQELLLCKISDFELKNWSSYGYFSERPPSYAPKPPTSDAPDQSVFECLFNRYYHAIMPLSRHLRCSDKFVFECFDKR